MPSVNAYPIEPTKPLTVNTYNRYNIIRQQTKIIDTTETVILNAVSNYLDIVQLVISNSGTTSTSCLIKDSTGGITAFHPYIPAGSLVDIPFAIPLTQTGRNNNWTLTSGQTTTLLVLVIAQENI